MYTISWEQAQHASRPLMSGRPSTPVLVRCAVLTVLALALGGVLSAVLWSQLANPPLAQVEAGQVFTGSHELSRQFGMNLTYAWTSAAPALPIGALAGALWHRHGWVQAVAVALGGLASGLVAWRFGLALGPGDLRERVRAASVGDRLPNALQLDSPGLLLSAAVFALVGFVLAVAFFGVVGQDEAKTEMLDLPRGDPRAG